MLLVRAVGVSHQPSFAEYQFEVERNGKIWKFSARYSDFEALRLELGLSKANFPRKTLLHSTSTKSRVVELRQRAFKSWLETVLSEPTMLTNPRIKSFLSRSDTETVLVSDLHSHSVGTVRLKLYTNGRLFFSTPQNPTQELICEIDEKVAILNIEDIWVAAVGGSTPWPFDPEELDTCCFGVAFIRDKKPTVHIFSTNTPAEATEWLKQLLKMQTSAGLPCEYNLSLRWRKDLKWAHLQIDMNDVRHVPYRGDAHQLVQISANVLDRIKAGKDVFVFLDLIFLFHEDGWLSLQSEIWDNVHQHGKAPRFVRFVLKEDLENFEFCFFSHKWSGENPLHKRTNVRDFWCSCVGISASGHDPSRWHARTEPVWCWYDQLSNPQDATKFGPLKSFTLTQFGVLASHSTNFFVYEGFSLIPWSQAKHLARLVVDELGIRIHGSVAWKESGGLEKFMSWIEQQPFFGVICPDSDYDERAWCQVEIAAKRRSKRTFRDRPLWSTNLEIKSPTDGRTYVSAHGWSRIVMDIACGAMEIPKTQPLEKTFAQPPFTMGERVQNIMLRKLIPNVDCSGSTSSVLSCSTISFKADIPIILVPHVCDLLRSALPQCSFLSDSDVDVGVVTSHVSSFIDYVLAEDTLSAPQTCITGAVWLAWLATIDLVASTNGGLASSLFIVHLSMIMLRFSRLTSALEQHLAEFSQGALRDEWDSLKTFVNCVLSTHSIPTFNTPVTLSEVTTWAKVVNLGVLGEIFNKETAQLCIPFATPERKPGDVVNRAQDWARSVRAFDWNDMFIVLGSTKAMMPRFNGISGRIHSGERFREQGLAIVGVEARPVG